MFLQKPTVVQRDGKIIIEVVCQATGKLQLDWFRGDNTILSDNKYTINTVVSGDKHTATLTIVVNRTFIKLRLYVLILSEFIVIHFRACFHVNLYKIIAMKTL